MSKCANPLPYAEAFRYEPETGHFYWLVCRGGGAPKAGKRAGFTNEQGYVVICLNNTHVGAHRLAWFMVNGDWPKGQIDHINGIRDDNRIVNLRDVSHAMNNQNRRVPKSKTGYLGVHHDPRYSSPYQAQISVNGVAKWLGSFDTPELAHAAYLAAKRTFHEGNTL